MPVLRCEQSSESKAQQEMPKEKETRTFLLEAIAFIIFQMFVSTRRKMFMNSVGSLLFSVLRYDSMNKQVYPFFCNSS